ncbi:hypothetical protein [Clostridium magnum]|uniref:Uncharacterized protein n=1 Tax=Clostridium magnum DSM 2767 TaxID=1121326 RepID=A0A162QYQ0_9CLOT|nr:hypothetical protein [Clostridium magnum]KZL89163.1 hypothetical protein CLMAG_53810 [Clostridium magnum DSM 2767]SHJ25181.1 hypothetical protein SAMN02745944_05613 [Clostridium magnum DSM 2767]
MVKKTNKDKGKNLDKVLEQLVRIRLYGDMYHNICNEKQDVQSTISLAVELLYSELEQLDKINYANAVCILSDFEDFAFLIGDHVRYKGTMNDILIHEKILSNKDIKFVIQNAVQRLNSHNINLKELLDFFVDTTLFSNKSPLLTFLIDTIFLYVMILVTYKIKIKNNKFLGLVERNESFEIKYGKDQVISKDAFVKLSEIEEKVEFVYSHKGFCEFFNSYFELSKSILQISVDKFRENIVKLGPGFSYNEAKYVYLKESFSRAYPFIETKEFKINRIFNDPRESVECNFMLLDNNLSDILGNRKYALGKNGAIIEFLNKNKAVDFVEVVENNEDYYFKVRYFNSKGILYEHNINEVTSFARKVNLEYTDHIITCNKEEVNSLISKIANDGLEANLKVISKLFQTCNYIFIVDYEAVKQKKITNQEYTNNHEHKIKQGVMLLNCLYVLYCDIKNKEVRIYNRKIEDSPKGTRIVRAVYRTAYIRKLPEGWQVSDEAKSNAGRLSVILPDGYTFVREHIPPERKDSKRVVKIKA